MLGILSWRSIWISHDLKLDVYRVNTNYSVADYAYRSTRTGINQVTKLQQIWILPLSKYIPLIRAMCKVNWRPMPMWLWTILLYWKFLEYWLGNPAVCSLACLIKKGKDGKYYDQVEFKKDLSVLRDLILETYKELSWGFS